MLEVQVSQVGPKLIDSLKKLTGVKSVEASGDLFSIRGDRDLRAEISKVIIECGCLPLQMRTQDYTLEEIYMKYFHEE